MGAEYTDISQLRCNKYAALHLVIADGLDDSINHQWVWLESPAYQLPVDVYSSSRGSAFDQEILQQGAE